MARPALAVPVEAVLLLALVDRATENLLECREVDLALGEGFGEQGLQVFDVLGDNVRRTGLRVVGGDLLHVATIQGFSEASNSISLANFSLKIIGCTNLSS